MVRAALCDGRGAADGMPCGWERTGQWIRGLVSKFSTSTVQVNCGGSGTVRGSEGWNPGLLSLFFSFFFFILKVGLVELS